MTRTEVIAAIAAGEHPYAVAAMANAINNNSRVGIHDAPVMEDSSHAEVKRTLLAAHQANN